MSTKGPIAHRVCVLSHAHSAIPWTVGHQTLLSMDYLSKNTAVGFHFPPADFPDPGIKPVTPVAPAHIDPHK